MQINTPKEIVELNMEGAVSKANLKLPKMIALGILAGMFIALGGATSSTASHSIANFGLAKTLSGVIFPVGLIMIILVGGELFTGNCLMVMATIDKRIKLSQFVRNLVVVFLANFVGSFMIDLLIFYSGNLNASQGLLGASVINTAIMKASITPIRGITSGILCNILVCVAILTAASAKDVAGKILATWFPIFVFVIGGFEHVIANMYYIPIGMLAATNSDYVTKAQEAYGITAEQLENLSFSGLISNYLPVTIGNIIGGVLVGFIVYYIQIVCNKKK